MIGLIIGRIRCGKSTLALFLVRNLPRVIFVDRTGEMGPTDHIVRQFPEDCEGIDWNAKRLRVSWRCQAEWQFLNSLTDFTIVIDEADTHWEEGKSGVGVIRDTELMQLIARGGHYGLHILFITQYPFQMPRFIRTQAARVYCLSLMEERDRAYVMRSWGLTPPDQRYKYVLWSDGGEESTQPEKRKRKRKAQEPAPEEPEEDAEEPEEDAEEPEEGEE